MMKNTLLFGIGLWLLALPSAAQETATGFVFEDRNQNGVKERREKGIAGVSVTNGTEVVQTDAKGRYRLPVGNDQIIAVIKPGSYDVPVDDNQLPQFYYIHKPGGSPELEYPGVAPTGPLPRAVNFPLIKKAAGEDIRTILFGRPQAYTEDEVEYYKKGVTSEQIGTASWRERVGQYVKI